MPTVHRSPLLPSQVEDSSLPEACGSLQSLLAKQGLLKWLSALQQEEILDVETLALASTSDLRSLQMPLGHALRLIAAAGRPLEGKLEAREAENEGNNGSVPESQSVILSVPEIHKEKVTEEKSDLPGRSASSWHYLLSFWARAPSEALSDMAMPADHTKMWKKCVIEGKDGESLKDYMNGMGQNYVMVVALAQAVVAALWPLAEGASAGSLRIAVHCAFMLVLFFQTATIIVWTVIYIALQAVIGKNMRSLMSCILGSIQAADCFFAASLVSSMALIVCTGLLKLASEDAPIYVHCAAVGFAVLVHTGVILIVAPICKVVLNGALMSERQVYTERSLEETFHEVWQSTSRALLKSEALAFYEQERKLYESESEGEPQKTRKKKNLSPLQKFLSSRKN